MMLGFVGGIGGIVVDRRRVVVTAKGGGKKGGKSGDKNGVAKGAGVGFGVVKSEENAKRKVGEGLSVSPSTDGTELDVVDNRTEEEIMAAYGVYKSKGSDILQKRAEDRKRAKEQAEKNKVSNYDRFVKLVGPDGVGTFEKAVTGGSVVFLTIVVVCGIAIAYEAYVKATGGAVPEGFDDLLVKGVLTVFTPALLLFFSCSISLGLLKSAQIDAANDQIIMEEQMKRAKQKGGNRASRR